MTLPYNEPLVPREPAERTIPEPPRRGEAGGPPCRICTGKTTAAVWSDDNWTLHPPVGGSLPGGGLVAFPPPFPLQFVRPGAAGPALDRGAADRRRPLDPRRQPGPHRLRDGTRRHGRRRPFLGLPQRGFARRRVRIDRRHRTLRRTPGHYAISTCLCLRCVRSRVTSFA